MTIEHSIQALRIPTGWNVAYNEWRGIDPEHPNAGLWLIEDLLQLIHPDRNLLVDVGLYGGDSGSFAAVMHQGDFQGPELARFRSRKRSEIAAAIELWLANPQAFVHGV